MKKIILFLLFATTACWTANGQSSGAMDMNFQALARDGAGKLLSNQPVQVRIAFSSREEDDRIHYAEVHQAQTDALGLFNLTIGQGRPEAGALAEIPWDKRQIWMDIALQTAGSRDFELLQSTKLRAVPYAFYAPSANRLTDAAKAVEQERQKNQSVRWNTSGNLLTVPETQYIGTRDNRDVVIKTNSVTRAVLTKEGQLQITGGATVRGNDNVESSYPVVIQGSKQGIHIKVNGSRNNDNNFVTFGDPEEFMWGAVEGQTIAELKAGWEYQLQVALFTLQGVSLTAQAIGVGIEAAGLYAAGTGAAASLIFAFAAPGFYAAAAATTAQAIVIGVQAAALAAEAITWGIKIEEDIGVTYSSGKGDYAEYLERNPAERDLQYGEIVGVKGGQVSLNTKDADHVLVVSSGPIFAGKAPQPDQEHRYERVAFLGQVPVRVAGKVDKGDYILASGNNDGMGIAVKPADMDIADFSRVVGVAWESAKDNPVNIIKIGVGINAQDLAPKVEDISKKVDNIVAYLEGKEPLRSSSGHPSAALVQAQTGQAAQLLFSDQEFDQIIDADATVIRRFYADLEKQLQTQGAVIPDHPALQDLFRDPVSALKTMRRDPALQNHWAQVDRMIKK